MTPQDAASPTFDANLARVEAIVKELEGGSVALDRAVALFKEGKALVRACEAHLKGAKEEIARASAEPAGLADSTLDDEPPF